MNFLQNSSFDPSLIKADQPIRWLCLNPFTGFRSFETLYLSQTELDDIVSLQQYCKVWGPAEGFDQFYENLLLKEGEILSKHTLKTTLDLYTLLQHIWLQNKLKKAFYNKKALNIQTSETYFEIGTYEMLLTKPQLVN